MRGNKWSSVTLSPTLGQPINTQYPVRKRIVFMVKFTAAILFSLVSKFIGCLLGENLFPLLYTLC